MQTILAVENAVGYLEGGLLSKTVHPVLSVENAVGYLESGFPVFQFHRI